MQLFRHVQDAPGVGAQREVLQSAVSLFDEVSSLHAADDQTVLIQLPIHPLVGVGHCVEYFLLLVQVHQGDDVRALVLQEGVENGFDVESALVDLVLRYDRVGLHDSVGG